MHSNHFCLHFFKYIFTNRLWRRLQKVIIIFLNLATLAFSTEHNSNFVYSNETVVFLITTWNWPSLRSIIEYLFTFIWTSSAVILNAFSPFLFNFIYLYIFSVKRQPLAMETGIVLWNIRYYDKKKYFKQSINE